MKKQHSFLKLNLGLLVVLIIFAGCNTKFLKVDNEEKLKKNDEFENFVQISQPVTTEVPPVEIQETAPSSQPASKVKKENSKTKTGASKNAAARADKKSTAEIPIVKAPETNSIKRQPEFEDDSGFSGRRPLVDPFRVGEEVVHDVRYFKVHAGTIKFKVEPFVQVNQRKAYSFAYEIETSSLFSSFYSVEDRAVVLVDFLELIPRVFTLHVKESAQLREARSYFDFEKLKATYWEKKFTKKNGHEEKKEEWDILEYSQNVFSAAFYMRTFQWKVGKEIAFRVSDNKENLVFKGKCIRRETLETDAGIFDAVVIKPEIELQGKFKPVGDIFIWLSNDDRKYILRIESSIKIGTLVSQVTKLTPGF